MSSATKDLMEDFMALDEMGDSWKIGEDYMNLYTRLSEQDEHADNSEMLWRLARAAYQNSNGPNVPKEQKAQLIKKALHTIRRSLEINEQCAQTHKWASLIVGVHSLTQSLREKAQATRDVRRHIDRAIELDPTDAVTYHISAAWCFNIASLSFLERQAAKLLFLDIPSSTFEEVLEWFEKAENISQTAGRSQNILNAAIAYVKTEQPQKAVPLLHRILKLSCETTSDHKAHEEAKELLQSLE